MKGVGLYLLLLTVAIRVDCDQVRAITATCSFTKNSFNFVHFRLRVKLVTKENYQVE